MLMCVLVVDCKYVCGTLSPGNCIVSEGGYKSMTMID